MPLGSCCGQVFKDKVGMLAEVGLGLAQGLFSLLARTSLAENMAACLLLVSTLVELLDQQAAPLLQPIASTAERVSPLPSGEQTPTAVWI